MGQTRMTLLMKTHWTWRNHVGIDQEAFPLLTAFHSTERYYAGCWEEKVINALNCKSCEPQ